ARNPRLALRPAPQTLAGADGAGADRHAVEEAAQLVGQGVGTDVALAGLLLQAFEADRLQVARQARLEAAGRHRFLGAYLLQRGQHRRRQERRPTGEALVEDRPEGVHIDGRADFVRPPGSLLRGHVARRAHDVPGAGLAGVATEQLGEAEVGDL